MRKLLTLILFLIFVTPVHAAVFTLSSTSFTDGEKIAVDYTCDGKNISPQLEWKNAPAKTVTFAIIVSDPDAPNGTFYHWVLFNIPRAVTNLAENMSSLPAGTIAGKNSYDKTQYNGPCPPQGAEHRYIFSLYALDSKLDLTDETDAQLLLDAMQNHILGVAEIKTKFSR